MSKFDEKDIERLLNDMPDINDQQSSDFYYEKIERDVAQPPTRKRSKQKSWFYPVLGSVAALFMVILLSMQFLPNGNSSFDEASVENSDEASSDGGQPENKQLAMEDAEGEQAEQEETGEESEHESKEIAEQESEEQNEELSVDSFSRVVHSSEAGNNNFVTYFFPDKQMQLLIPVTFSQQSTDPFEAFNHARDLIPEDFPLNDDFYDFLTFQEIDSNGDPVVRVDVSDFKNAYPGGTAGETYLLGTIQAYFAQLDEDLVILENENGENVSLSHTGELDEPLQVESEEKRPYKVIHVKGAEQPYYVAVPDYSGASTEQMTVEEAIQQMKQQDEYTDAEPSLPNNWNIQVIDQTDHQLTVTIENVDGAGEEDRIIAIETILLTAKSFGFEEVIVEIDGVEQIGRYPMGEPIQVPQYINPYK